MRIEKAKTVGRNVVRFFKKHYQELIPPPVATQAHYCSLKNSRGIAERRERPGKMCAVHLRKKKLKKRNKKETCGNKTLFPLQKYIVIASDTVKVSSVHTICTVVLFSKRHWCRREIQTKQDDVMRHDDNQNTRRPHSLTTARNFENQ